MLLTFEEVTEEIKILSARIVALASRIAALEEELKRQQAHNTYQDADIASTRTLAAQCASDTAYVRASVGLLAAQRR